jgi:hypothetical protein
VFARPSVIVVQLAHSETRRFPSAIMDIDKLIRELNAEIDKLKRVVGCLEKLRGTSATSW